MRNYIVEFIGTFFLVLTVGLAVPLAPAGFAPIAIGSILMVMIYAGGHISGAHYNPAVTLAVLMRGKIDMGNALVYMGVQVGAGIAAALLARMLAGAEFGAPAIGEGHNMISALIAEIVFTFALAYVVLQTATTKSNAGNSFYGLAIGFTVLASAYAAGGISGGAFNPAVGIGPNILKMNIAEMWIYIVGPLAGGALAAIVFKMTYAGDDD